MRHFLQLGSQPDLSLAEAQSILPSALFERYGMFALIEDPAWDGAALQQRLGGTVKLGEILWEGPAKHVSAEQLADLMQANPRGRRILYGLTLAGEGTTDKGWKFLPIQLKKELKRRGLSARWVTGEQGDLSPAAVEKLALTTEGYDFIVARRGSHGWIGLTSHVQDATSWSERDFDKPFRDAKTGMLPPKLARMMLNMALGTREARTSTLLDPFCGSGTVLLEGMAIGMPRLHGNDLDDRQVAGAIKNVHWLQERRHMQAETTFSTQAAERLAGIGTFDVIVTEGYLGKPLRGHEPTAFLNAQKHEVEAIWNEALPRFAATQPAGGTLVCTTPAYLLPTGTLAVDIREAAHAAGYRAEGSWLYQRPDQRVARQVQRFQKT